jgi:hypothetical protein
MWKTRQARLTARRKQQRVPHVGHLDLHVRAVTLAQPGQVVRHARARQVVEHQHRLPVGQQAVGEVGADETGASRDKDRSSRVEYHLQVRSCRRDVGASHG